MIPIYHNVYHVVELIKRLKAAHKMKNKDIFRKVKERYPDFPIDESEIPQVLKKDKRWKSVRLHGRRR